MRIFEYKDYRKYLVGRISQMPNGGRGEHSKIAVHLHVHTSLVSQVFRGDKDFTLEQACLLAEFLGLNDLETEYFTGLVELARAGSRKWARLIEKRLDELRMRAAQVAARLPTSKALPESEKSTFYSQWYYSGIRLLTSIEKYQNIDAIAERTQLPKNVVGKVLDFLISSGLIVERNSRLAMGPARTHVPADSPLVARHHSNWRLKALEYLPTLQERDLFFTSPMTVSRRDRDRIRELLGDLIESIAQIVDKSDPEILTCLNIDCVEIR